MFRKILRTMFLCTLSSILLRISIQKSESTWVELFGLCPGCTCSEIFQCWFGYVAVSKSKEKNRFAVK